MRHAASGGVCIKPPINRRGNKTCLLDTLLPLIPKHLAGFCEVFGGSGALTFSMPVIGREKEIYNDFDQDLVNFMLVLRERPFALLFELYQWPMNSHAEFDIIKHCFYPKTIRSLQDREDARRYGEATLQGNYTDDELARCKGILCEEDYHEIKEILQGRAALYDVKRAAAFFKLMRYSYGSSGTSYGGQFIDITRFCRELTWCSRRLRKVVIQNLDFERLIAQYDADTMFFYCDPPYHTTEDVYAVAFPECDHLRLRDTLQKIKGRCMISYNDDSFIRALYAIPGFWTIPVERPNSLSSQKDAVFKELIILNYDPASVLDVPKQLSWEEMYE